jgi:hypothetical protein
LTHCPLGHAYDEANTFLNKKGAAVCLVCKRQRGRVWWAKTHVGGRDGISC